MKRTSSLAFFIASAVLATSALHSKQTFGTLVQLFGYSGRVAGRSVPRASRNLESRWPSQDAPTFFGVLRKKSLGQGVLEEHTSA